MQDSAKYLIHADVTANGVVERSDVVGAVFGQTEGLLGDGLDLRELQEAGKLGRIDVEIQSEGGASFGEITIASRLDRVETAILAAGLESIERVGPCRASVEISDIEDARSAKRRAVVERAKELLASFDEQALSSEDIVEEVRRSVRVEDITEWEGLPAGPRVADSDAVIVVEGRADVLTLLEYGIKNAVAVEGTDVPDAIAGLTHERTVTAFLDSDRGGDLILRELAQVGDLDYVAVAPSGTSVEDLSRGEVMTALREKVPFEAVDQEDDAVETLTAIDGSARPAPPEAVAESSSGDTVEDPPSPASAGTDQQAAGSTDEETPDDHGGTTGAPASNGSGADSDRESATDGERTQGGTEADESEDGHGTLAGHVAAVVHEESGAVRLLDGEFETLAEGEADAAFDLIESAEEVPATVVLDGALTQRVLDVAAQRGVEQVVARSTGEFVKQPTDVRVRTAEEF